MTEVSSPIRPAALPVDRHHDTRTAALTDVSCVTLVALILLQRVAIPVGAQQAPLITFLLPCYVIWAAWRGYLEASRPRVIVFCIAMCLVTLSAIINSAKAGFSPLSLLYLWVIYSVSIFTTHHLNLRKLFDVYQWVMIVLSLVGIAQFAAQFAGVASIDPFAVLPQQIVLQGYNTFPALYYGAALHKANAIVFMEPSHLSKALALAILIELLGKQRIPLLLCFFGCYATTFSGTGLIALFAGVAFALRGLNRQTILWGTSITIVIVAGMWLSGFMDVWIARASEFNDDGSSATARFVNPYVLLNDLVRSDSWVMGNGPGSLPAADAEGHEISPPPEVKLAYEYGMPAAVLFTGYMIYCICSSAAPLAIGASVLAIYFLLGGSLLEPFTVYLCYLMSMLPVKDQTAIT